MKRVIQDSICDSESIAMLSWFEECLMTRLITVCDDYGCFDGRASIIRCKVFPLVQKISEKEIENGLKHLQKAGTIFLYKSEGKPFIQFRNWDKYQRIRFLSHKYPTYEERDSELPDQELCGNLPQIAADCRNFPQSAAQEKRREEKRSEEKRSEEKRSEENINARSDENAVASEDAPAEPSVIDIILNDKTSYGVKEHQVEEWSSLFPAVDVMCELRKMSAWSTANPTKRKTRKGIERFIVAWLSKTQDSVSVKQQRIQPKPREYSNPVFDALERGDFG